MSYITQERLKILEQTLNGTGTGPGEDPFTEELGGWGGSQRQALSHKALQLVQRKVGGQG